MTYRCWVWVAVLSALVVASVGMGVTPAAATEPPGSGALRLTNTDGSQASGLFYNDSIPTIGGLEITFKQYQYGGDGDGIAFVLAVAPPPPTLSGTPTSIGAYGGALGYTSGDVVDGTGLPGGWLGIGLDVFGNFTSTNVDGSGCTYTDMPWASPVIRPNEVTVRGPGNGTVGYCLLSSSLEAGLDDRLGPLGFQLHGVDRASSLRSFRIVIDPSLEPYRYTVEIELLPGGGDYSYVTSGRLPSFYYDPVTGLPVDGTPPYVTFGWTASTGGAVDIHEITDVVVKNLDGLVLLSDTFTEATTSEPVFGLPPGAGFPCLTAGSDPDATPVPGCALAAAGFTTTFAQSVPDVPAPLGGGIVTLGNIEIDESQAGTISTGALIDIRLEAGLTFSGAPTFSTPNGTELVVVPVGCQSSCTRFRFQVTASSTTIPAQILISNISVVVPSGSFPSIGFCDIDTDLPNFPVCVHLDRGDEGDNGFTPSGELVIAALIPVAPTTLTGMSINTVGGGVTTTVILFGENLDQLDLRPGRDTISFGPGITVVPGSVKVSLDGTQITLKIKVDANALPGLHDVTITHPGIGPIVLDDQFQVNAPPMVASAGTGPDGTGALLSPLTDGVLKGQTLIITGTGFQAPTAAPSNLLVALSGTGITVNAVGYMSSTQLSVNVDVAAGAQAVSLRTVTVTNPDLGTATGGGTATSGLLVLGAPADAPVGLSPTATSGTVTLPPTASIIKITPTSAPTGFSPVTITGTKFSATLANNLVSFTGPNNLPVLATIISATTTSLKVAVPTTAVDGPVTVSVGGPVGNGINFTITNPTVSAVTVPDGPAKRGGPQVHVHVIGTKFQSTAKVAFNPSLNLTLGALTVTPTEITVPVTVTAGAVLGLRDVTVTNGDGGSSTLAQSFAVNGQFPLALSLTTLQGAPVAAADFPTDSTFGVVVTLDGNGKCTARVITPTVYLLKASFPGTQPALFPKLTFTLDPTRSSALPGTATNDDCEPNLAQVPPLPAEKDFSIGPVSQADVTLQQVKDVTPDGSVYTVKLASWDRGGSVHIDVADSAGTVGAGITLGVPFSTTMSAADGLTDFQKRRGVYLVVPKKGQPGGPLLGYTRLDPTLRNLFVRGLGFSGDPTLQDGNCGIDSTTGAQLPASLTSPLPCPQFQVGTAFAGVGVQVWDVSNSFNADGTTVFPTQSLADPNKSLLALATVTYDATNCSGGASCDHTSKLGPRQWNFPTLGFSTFNFGVSGSKTLVLGKPVRAYFLDRPYLHQENGTNAAGGQPYLPANGGVKKLAPITIVCDTVGSDDGATQKGECPGGAAGTPGGDVYVPGRFDQHMSAMDVNNDGCVELPAMADSRTLTPCNPNSALPSLDFSAAPPQATFQQVVRHIITHELGHAVGINVHTSVAADVMYMYSTDWTRDVNFSPQARAMIKITNKGQP